MVVSDILHPEEEVTGNMERRSACDTLCMFAIRLGISQEEETLNSTGRL